MIKIGDFSKLAHVSIKTLHHYDELGLLKPVRVDRYTGYRYYNIEQLSRLNRILALKDLGFSLEQVAQLLGEDLSTAEMRGMLRLKQMELAERLKEEQSRLLRVEQRLKQLEHEGLPIIEVAMKEVPAQTVLAARVVAAQEEQLFPARQSLQSMLQQHLDLARLKPSGPWLALLNDLPYAESDLEVTLAVGVTLRSGQRAGDWLGSPVWLQELDAVPGMASVIHQGEYATLPQTSAALYGWTQANGLQATGPIREIYLPADGVSTPPIADTYTGCIEVQCPVEPAYIPLSIQPGLISNQGDTKTMEPEIKNRPAFKAVGLSYVGKNEHGEIPQLWDRFNPRFHEPKNINSVECFGLCISNLKDAQPGEFEYVACVEVADDRDIPDGMVCREVPAYKYAVFTHHGKLDTLGETYQYIYNTWLPQSGMELNPDKFDMEVYTDEFILGDDKSKFYIWVALA